MVDRQNGLSAGPNGATPPHIVILGGGTAGWMAACLFAHHWRALGATITLVESPEIGIIGVGEGSTPHLKHFFDTLGLSEAQWMPRCDATYKTGIEFRGWSNAPGHDRYFHPFPTELDTLTEGEFFAACAARRRGEDVPATPDPWFLTARLAREGRAPVAPPNFPFRIGYGYHFDAHKVGAMLREHALPMGVRHVSGKVASVEMTPDGAIAALMLEDGARIDGDCFVDCSGFRSVLHQGALGVRFLPFADNLFNDSAVVIPTPRPEGEIAPQTVATAMSAGWAWRIPLTSRVGNGYVYASRYQDQGAAEAELRAHLGVGEDVEARHLTMRVGRVENSWHANCLAVGLSQGFLEPLEATALHIVQATLEAFIQCYGDGGFTARHRDAFNRTINVRYEGIRDYIVAHYRLNRVGTAGYWADNAAHDRLSDSLKRVITAWFTGADFAGEIMGQDIARYYTPMSWHALFAGYGTFPTRLRPARWTGRDGDSLDAMMAGCASNFPGHADWLDELGERA